MNLDLDADQLEFTLTLTFYKKEDFSLGIRKEHNIIIIEAFSP